MTLARKNKKGFTFIEMIIVITIIFIMTAVLMDLSFRDRAKKDVETSGRELTAAIRETQNNSLTGKQYSGNDRLPCAFRFVVGEHTYTMQYQTRDIDGECAGWDTFHTVKLPEGLTLSAYAYNPDQSTDWTSVDQITFDVPYGRVTIGDGGEGAGYKGVEISLKKGDKRYVVCVHAIGLIEELGLQSGEEHVCVF